LGADTDEVAEQLVLTGIPPPADFAPEHPVELRVGSLAALRRPAAAPSCATRRAAGLCVTAATQVRRRSVGPPREALLRRRRGVFFFHGLVLSAEAVSSTGLFYLYCLYCSSAGRQATASCQLSQVQDAVQVWAVRLAWLQGGRPRLSHSSAGHGLLHRHWPLTVGTTTAAPRPFALRCATLAGRGKSGGGRESCP